MIITIDGPVASGKSSLGQYLAQKLKVNYLDSGQVYRLLITNYQKEKNQIQTNRQKRDWLIKFRQKTTFQNQQLCWEGIPTNQLNLYQPQTDQDSIALTTQNIIRKTVNKICQEIIKNKSFVVVGRDANTVICPFSDYKFFLTANFKIRVERKYHFWKEKQTNDHQKREVEIDSLAKATEYVLARDRNDIKFQIQQMQKLNEKQFGYKTENKTTFSMKRWETLQGENGANKIDNSKLTLLQTFDQVVTLIQSKQKHLTQIAIIGRTNVGKSTLFNALMGQKQVLISPTNLTTRDNYQSIRKIKDTPFLLVDTGGIEMKKQPLNYLIWKKLANTVKESDYLLWMVDHTTIDQTEAKIKQLIKTKKQNTVLIINKVDKKTTTINQNQFDCLGIKTQIPISAKNQRNIDVLEKWISTKINHYQSCSELPKKTIKVAFIGKTNVGKSSIFNLFIKQQVAITFDQPHTTTNFVKGKVCSQEKWFTFFDTAGMRKKTNKREINEQKAFLQTDKLINDMDFVILVYAANEELTIQEKRNVKLILDKQKPFLVIGNKSDLIKGKKSNLLDKLKHFIPRLRKEKVPIFLTNIQKLNKQKAKIFDLILKMYLKK